MIPVLNLCWDYSVARSFADCSLKLNQPVTPFSFTACRVLSQVLCGLDDSWCSIWREGSSKERTLPGPGVSPQLWSGETEDTTQPKQQQWVHLHTHDLSIFTHTWGAVRVSLAHRAASQSAAHDGSVDCPASVLRHWLWLCCSAWVMCAAHT